MSSWQECLKKSPVEWLLEGRNPSVRLFTLRDLLDRDENDSEIKEARAALSSSDIVTKISSKQKRAGHWEDSATPYLPKYKATYWQVMILGQLGVDRDDERVQRACDYVFGLQSKNGGFSIFTSEGAAAEYERVRPRLLAKGKPLPEIDGWAEALVKEQELSCLTGNVAAALTRLGYGDDSRVGKAVDWLLSIQNRDGGWLCPYWRAHVKDKHSCFYGTICPLEAFSEIPEPKRTPEMRSAIERAVEFLLMHRMYKADHHGFRVINRGWLKFSFPWFYSYNLLRGLSVVTKLGYVDDERLADAVRVLVQRRRGDGSWMLDSSPVGRMHVNIEPVGKPSKWVTLIALKALKRLYQTRNETLRQVISKA